MARCFIVSCMLTLSAVAVLVKPGDDKRKAIPLPAGRGSCSLSLEAEYPWRIGASWIEARNSETLWKRTCYFWSAVRGSKCEGATCSSVWLYQYSKFNRRRYVQ